MSLDHPAMTTEELVSFYKVNRRTILRWIEKNKDLIGDQIGLWTPKQVGVMRELFG